MASLDEAGSFHTSVTVYSAVLAASTLLSEKSDWSQTCFN